MRKANIPAIDGVQVFDDIVAAKYRPNNAILTSVRANVVDAYQKYLAAVPNVAGLDLTDVSAVQKDALHHAYNTSTAPLELMRDQLTKPILNTTCFLCSISEVSSLDHYLPKELYPQFSILPQNLIPSCSKCNSHKGTKVVDSNINVRRFLHSYFDVIPCENFLQASLEIKENLMVLKFYLVKPTAMAANTFAHLQSHFDELELSKRYMSNSLLHLREKRGSYQRTYGADNNSNRLRTKLAQEAQDLSDDYGPNYWRSVLYRALSEHALFCAGGFNVLNLIQ